MYEQITVFRYFILIYFFLVSGLLMDENGSRKYSENALDLRSRCVGNQ